MQGVWVWEVGALAPPLPKEIALMLWGGVLSLWLWVLGDGLWALHDCHALRVVHVCTADRVCAAHM